MDTASLVSKCYSDGADFAEAEILGVVVVVRGNPPNPHRVRVLTSKYSQRVIVLENKSTF